MDKITTMTNSDGVEQVIIDRGNGEFTSMPKSVYDTLPSESSIPSIPQAGA
jgi:hypothetical protein